MFMNNCVHLLGRLGRAPEIRTTNSGDRVATLSVVTSDVYKDKTSGEWVENPNGTASPSGAKARSSTSRSSESPAPRSR